MRRFLRIAVALAVILGPGLTTAAFCQDKYPSKPIELVLSTSAGSGAARYGQMLADVGSRILGVPIEVVYKPGGSSNESAVYISNKPADGYTLASWSMSRAGYMNLPGFNLRPEDFTYIMAMENQVFAFAVPSDSPFKTIQDMIQYAKDNPGKLNIGSTRIGSIHHQLVTSFAKAAGIEISYIPYQGTNDTLKDLLGKNLAVGLIQPGLLMSHVKAGTVRVLLTLNDKRLPVLPDVPTPKEIGLDYSIVPQLYGLMAPKGVPEDRVKIIEDAFRKVMDSPEYKEYLKQEPHVVPQYIGREELTDLFMKSVKDAREFMISNNIPVNNGNGSAR
jgi:tripartite-type tricarboxylate transporter receptor subunit TctC